MIGTTLSHYRITDELGRGGMGIVYKAEDTNLDRTVAIKVLPEGALTTDEDRARFLREAKAAAALNHPNIAVIYEVGTAAPDTAGAERPFIAMEFIEGQTLDARIQSAPLPLEDAVRITREVSDGLQAAHSKNIVHRDVKAANIMLDGQGRAKILDFGLALTAQSTKLTRMGSTLGTVACMSPEQARGEEVDQRTDIWAIGVLLYEMVSGQNPFKADYEQAVVYNIINEEPEPLTARRTGVPMGLEFITNKCLSKDKTARYASAADLMVDLDSLEGLTKRLSTLSSGPGQVATPLSTAQSTSSRMPWLLSALAAVLVGVMGWILGSRGPEPFTEVRTFQLEFKDANIVSGLTVGPEDRDALLQVGTGVGSNAMIHWSLEDGSLRTLAESGFFFFPSISNDGTMAVYTSGGTGTHFIDLESGNTTNVISGYYGGMSIKDDRLVALPQNSTTATSIGFISLSKEGNDERLVVATDSSLGHSGIYPIKVLNGGRSLLGYAERIDINRDIILANLESGEYQVLAEQAWMAGLDKSGYLYWESTINTDVRALLARKFDSGTGQFKGETFSLQLPQQYPDARPFVSPEGTLFLFGNQTLPYILRWLDSNDPVEMEDGASLAPALSHDGSRVVSLADDGTFANVTDLSSGTVLRVHQGGYHTMATWTADDRFILLSGDRNVGSRILKVAADGSGQVDTVHVSTRFAREGAVSPDGQYLAYLTSSEYDDMSPWEIWLKDLDSGEERILESKPGQFLHNPMWSPDGRFIAYEVTIGEGSFGTGQAIRVREVASDRDWLISQGSDTDRFWDPAWSPDGAFIYFREPTALYRRGVRSEPSFGPVGQVETVQSFIDEFNYTISPTTGDILVRAPDISFDRDAPDLVMIQNWANAWKAERDIR